MIESAADLAAKILPAGLPAASALLDIFFYIMENDLVRIYRKIQVPFVQVNTLQNKDKNKNSLFQALSEKELRIAITHMGIGVNSDVKIILFTAYRVRGENVLAYVNSRLNIWQPTEKILTEGKSEMVERNYLECNTYDLLSTFGIPPEKIPVYGSAVNTSSASLFCSSSSSSSSLQI